MKVLIFSNLEKGHKAESIKSLCYQLGSEPSIYNTDISSESGLSSSLDQTDIIIILWSPKSIYSPEILFSTGYYVGRKKTFVIFGNEKEYIPHFNGKAVFISSRDALSKYISEQITLIDNMKNMEDAKNRILEMGYELNISDLVTVVSDGESLVLEQFLQAGFSPDSSDKNGVSILNIAIREGHIHIATILIEKGANINVISGDRGNTPLMDAAAEANTLILKKLIKAGADLDLKSKSGQTALVLSVGRQAEEAAIILIDSGADITISDDLGMSARKYAELFKLDKVIAVMNNIQK